MQKQSTPNLILKVGLCKAFDIMDWDFLLELLKTRGFGNRWARWIKAILISSKANFLINGAKSGYVRYRRGLRQGDPLSPLLFILVTDVLSTMFGNALKSRILYGIPLGHAKKICHLQFANDLLILTSGGRENLRIMKLLLYLF